MKNNIKITKKLMLNCPPRPFPKSCPYFS